MSPDIFSICAGTVHDNSASPITWQHIKLMSEAYSRAGTPDAVTRRLNILFIWFIAGRSSEGAWTMWSGCFWSLQHLKLFVEVPQQKVSKPKYVAFGPGSNRYMCILLAFGDYFAIIGYGVFDDTSPSWMLPDLRSTSQPGTKLGAQMKALLPQVKGGAVGYQEYAIDSLPADTCAAGVRHGVIDHLQTKAPIEINLHGTGQTSMAQESTFRTNYAGVDRAACGTVQRILAGFPPPQWGTTSDGPFSPRIESLSDIGVDVKELEDFVDELYDIHSASNPDFQRGGRLRAFLHACIASQIMYYCERVVHSATSPSAVCNEMRVVCLKMQQCLQDTYLKTGGGSASSSDQILKSWGEHIRTDFDRLNLDITTRTDLSGTQLASQNAVIQKLGASVATATAGQSRLEKQNDIIVQQNDRILHMLETERKRNDELVRENAFLRLENDRLKSRLAGGPEDYPLIETPSSSGETRRSPALTCEYTSICLRVCVCARACLSVSTSVRVHLCLCSFCSTSASSSSVLCCSDFSSDSSFVYMGICVVTQVTRSDMR